MELKIRVSTFLCGGKVGDGREPREEAVGLHFEEQVGSRWKTRQYYKIYFYLSDTHAWFKRSYTMQFT